jgi:hypothetical protein
VGGLDLALHLGAAIATAAFTYWLLRLRAERDFLRGLAASLAPTAPSRVTVGAPDAFLARFARALGIAFEHAPGRGDARPVRLRPRALMELFVRRGIVLIRCEGPEPGKPLVVEITLGGDSDASQGGAATITPAPDAAPKTALEASLAAALGEAVDVRLRYAAPARPA